MADLPANHKRVIPEAFHHYRRQTFERTVRLTEQAIAKLEAAGQTVTLAGICEATRELDERSKGLRPTALLRNPQAAELFHLHSPAYQERQHKARSAKRQRAKAKTHSEARATYRGLRTSDLIQMLEDLKAQFIELKGRQEKLQVERDEARRLRDEALHQNTRLLATLATTAPSPIPKRG